MYTMADNRYSFSEIHDSFFRQCEKLIMKRPAQWCCLAIDVENFKLFNKIYGRERGNELLVGFSEIFREIGQRIDCVCAYLGQDDFALFMEYDREEIENLYGRLRSVAAEMGNAMGFLPAIGIYRLGEDEQAGLAMYDKAVAAAADAKKHQTRRVSEHDFEAYEREKNEYQMLLNLRRAVDQGRITFYLQPQCRISTRKIVGAEALVRWIDEDGTMISPGRFVPILEKNGFISDFDKMIWEMVCRWIRSLLDRGIMPVPISINVSQVDILSMDVAQVLCELCELYRLPSNLLKVEITESAYAEATDRVQNLVKNLRSRGFVTMMDDFGSGYSSLNMLENVAVDVLKLDMIFVKEANLHSRRGVTIIESIVNMAKMMGLPIVVEGIETEEQVRFLNNLGCRYAQGYYFYKPITREAFEELMLSGSNADYRGFLCKMNEQIHVREFLDENTFTDTMLNNILGAVAFYSLEGKDLTITRFNEQFYKAIGDAAMEKRQVAIQNYVVKEDWPALYRALDDALLNTAVGGTCEARFYKSDGSIFWFRMHFFYLTSEQEKKIYYGQVEDVTEFRQQSLQFFEVLRKQSDVAMMLNLDRGTIRYVTGSNTMYQIGLPSVDLATSIDRTVKARIENAEDRRRFREFFNVERMKEAHRRAIYHESLTVGFRMKDVSEPVEFSTYCIRTGKDQDLVVYAFARIIGGQGRAPMHDRRM